MAFPSSHQHRPKRGVRERHSAAGLLRVLLDGGRRACVPAWKSVGCARPRAYAGGNRAPGAVSDLVEEHVMQEHSAPDRTSQFIWLILVIVGAVLAVVGW